MTGDVLLAALSCVSSPLRTEHSPLSCRCRRRRCRVEGEVGRQDPVHGVQQRLHRRRQRVRVGPGRARGGRDVVAHRRGRGQRAAEQALQDAVRLRLIETLARLPVPDAVGFPLPSSEADAVPHETLTFSSPVSIGTVQELDPVGVAVTPLPVATASCVVVEARPESDEDGARRARVGGGRGRKAGTGAGRLGHRCVAGVGLRAATGELQGVEEVERDEAAVGLHAPWAALGAGRGRHGPQQRHGHQPHRGDPDPTPHLLPLTVPPCRGGLLCLRR